MSTYQHSNTELTADKEAFWPIKQNGKCSMGQSNMSYTMAQLLQLGSIDTESFCPDLVVAVIIHAESGL